MGKVIKQEACPICSKTGLGKSLSIYEDGGTYCHECEAVEKGPSGQTPSGIISGIESRGLNKAVCSRYDIRQSSFTGHLGKSYIYEEAILLFNYYSKGRVVKTKTRTLADSRKCIISGKNTQCTSLFGQQAFNPTTKIPVIIVESELCAASVNQMIGYPAVATGGTGAAVKLLTENLEWLSRFANVILAFDNDEAGREATNKCLTLFEAGSVKVAHWPLKDANDMLMAGREEEAKRVLWNAEIIKPPTIVSVDDIMNKVLVKPTRGFDWAFKEMTKVTYGVQPGTMYTVASAEGIGKTLFLHELIFDMIESGRKVGLFSFEQRPESTIQRMVGTKLNKTLHLPDEDMEWNEDDIKETIRSFKDNLFLYNNAGTLTLEGVLLNIRYLVKCYGVQLLVIDNLTALSSAPKAQGKGVSELNYLIQAAGAFSSLCVELGITIILVTHVSNDTVSKSMHISTKMKQEDAYMDLTADEMNDKLAPAGSEWSSGRMPTLNNIYMGGCLRKLSDYVIVLARNRMTDDFDEKNTLKVKFLKSRLNGAYDGYKFNLKYNPRTGRLVEGGESTIKVKTNATDII